MGEKIQAWLAIAGAVLGPLAVWWWRFIERKDNRHDKGADWQEKRDERNWQRIERQLEDCHKSIKEKDDHIERVEADRDTWRDLAGAWYQRAGEIHWTGETLCRVINARPDTEQKVSMPPFPAFRDLMRKP